MRNHWQFGCFYNAQDLVDWMNEWDFIKIHHIVFSENKFIIFYRYSREIKPGEHPTEKELDNMLYT